MPPVFLAARNVDRSPSHLVVTCSRRDDRWVLADHPWLNFPSDHFRRQAVNEAGPHEFLPDRLLRLFEFCEGFAGCFLRPRPKVSDVAVQARSLAPVARDDKTTISVKFRDGLGGR